MDSHGIEAVIGDKIFNLEVAQTIFKKAKGLMFRKQISDNRGMIFVFEDDARRPFWMKFVRFPLDILWLDSEKRIIEIKNNCMPCKGLLCPAITPEKESRYVIEILGGTAEKLGVAAGDEVKFEL